MHYAMNSAKKIEQLHLELGTYLEHERSGGRREVEWLTQMVLWVVFAHVTVDHHSLGGTLLSNQEDSLALFGDGVDEKFCTDIVHHGNKNGAVFWGAVCWVMVRLHFIAPVLPLAW